MFLDGEKEMLSKGGYNNPNIIKNKINPTLKTVKKIWKRLLE